MRYSSVTIGARPLRPMRSRTAAKKLFGFVVGFVLFVSCFRLLSLKKSIFSLSVFFWYYFFLYICRVVLSNLIVMDSKDKFYSVVSKCLKWLVFAVWFKILCDVVFTAVTLSW